jgi:NADH-quinone oxidoreductase subunit L
LWVVGILTALLTAYYMSRLSGLAFFGKDRWNKAPIDPDDPGVHATGPITRPHESPWLMRIPLIVLAFLAFFGGVLSFPWSTHYQLLKWVDPVFGTNLYNAHESTRVQWELATLDAVIAIIGVVIALTLWSRRADRPKLEPTFLRRWWFFDLLLDTVFSRSGARLAQFSATVVEDGIIDGAVNGVGTLVRRTGGLVRKAQSGYVRTYALAIVLGVVAVLAFVLSHLWWS